ncbi:MAG TPA: MFS transporter [Rhodocyclaceae bacterium]|jgi:MFS family permease|nr:MFS transporter [Rhodocyclaceae bacterium]
MSGQFKLLSEKRFLPLFITQFLGAFNDNVLKNAMVILITFQGARMTAADPALLVNACAGIFILPFFLFSATSGQIADKYEKAKLIRLVKVLEICIMIIAAVGFWLPSLPWLLISLFLMGLHSTFFGPIKYSILPQHLHPDELIGGNGLIEAGTFLAILLGTILGGTLIGLGDNGRHYAAATCFVIAVLGYLASRNVPAAAAPEPTMKINWNPLSETWRNLVFAKQNRAVFLSILGISWFWFYGAVFLSQFPAFAKNSLGGGEGVVTLLLAIFSVGIGLGSLLCEKMSGGDVEPGLVPLGSIGLTLFAVDLYFSAPAGTTASNLSAGEFLAQAGSWHVLIDLVLIGVFGGFYCVPLYTLMQTRSEASHRSRIIAANNIVNALFMVVASLMAIALLGAGLSVPQLFLVTAILNAFIAAYIYSVVPEFINRFFAWLSRKPADKQ